MSCRWVYATDIKHSSSFFSALYQHSKGYSHMMRTTRSSVIFYFCFPPDTPTLSSTCTPNRPWRSKRWSLHVSVKHSTNLQMRHALTMIQVSFPGRQLRAGPVNKLRQPREANQREVQPSRNDSICAHTRYTAFLIILQLFDIMEQQICTIRRL